MSYKTFHHFLRVLFILLAMLTAMPMNQAEAANPLQRVGDVLQIAVPVYAFGLAMNEQGHEGMKQFAYTLISSQLTVHILKVTTNQKRPCYKEGDKKNSFPSGHTSAAFLGATFIHKRYGFKKAIIPYGAAILTGISRVQAKKHHVRDVIVGALISGFWTACFVDRKDNLTLAVDE